jgi:hypothetical protein
MNSVAPEVDMSSRSSREARPRADAQRAQEPAHGLERVVERQDAQEPVLGPELQRAHHGLDVGEQVRVREHDALRLPGRARGEEQHREVVRLGARGTHS